MKLIISEHFAQWISEPANAKAFNEYWNSSPKPIDNSLPFTRAITSDEGRKLLAEYVRTTNNP